VSDTPRTDAFFAGGGCYGNYGMLALLARDLERELTAAMGRINNLHGELNDKHVELVMLKKTNAMLADNWTNAERVIARLQRTLSRP
jgi:hypothetical protein